MKVLFAIECHDAEYVREIDDNGLDIQESDDGPNENDYVQINGPVIIKYSELNSEEELKKARHEIALEYQVKTESIIVYRLAEGA